jgi:ribose 5-phosphate isomerase B
VPTVGAPGGETGDAPMRVAVGSDDAGAPLRHVVIHYLASVGIAADDFGTDSDNPAYPVIAERVARSVADGHHDRAVLTCGTGLGVCIVANKIPGVYAALAHDVYSARRARLSNNAQILTMGARVIGAGPAREVVGAWLAEDFRGGPSAGKLALIADLEDRLHASPPGQ